MFRHVYVIWYKSAHKKHEEKNLLITRELEKLWPVKKKKLE